MSERIADITAMIDKLPIFADLSTSEVTQLAAYFRIRHWRGGETIFNEGDNSHDLIFIVAGSADILKKDKAGVAKPISRLEAKNVLGEAAFVDNSLRSATAVAVNDTVAIAMSQDHLESISDQHPRLAIKLLKKLNRLLALKLRKTSREFAESVSAAAAAASPSAAAAAKSR
jgi:CRP/FNR family transcriptional regulator